MTYIVLKAPLNSNQPTNLARRENFVSNFCVFWINDPFQTVATARIAPKTFQGQPPHLAHTVPDFIQIGSLSAEL